MPADDDKSMRAILSGPAGDDGPYDPVRRAQKQMRTPLPRRFYDRADIEEADGSYRIVLDGRPVRTPGRATLALANEALARIAAAEWAAQAEEIDPDTMPMTRLVNTAIDGVANDMQAVGEDVIRYAGTDLVCYRAGEPDRLVERQAEAWDPLLEWAAASLGARFVLAEGVMHVRQPKEAIAAFSVHVGQFRDALDLASLHVATTLTGSALITMALARKHLTPEGAWQAAHVDEDWNMELWGEDHEAMKRRAARRRDFDAAAAVLGFSAR